MMTRGGKKSRDIKVGLISLGCAKNLVDAEVMLGALMGDGMEITNDPREADVVIINTCGFIDAAQEESVDTILESAQLREASQRGQGLVVSGCLPQRYREELPRLLPEVDVFMGIDQITQAPELVREALARRRRRLVAGKPAKQGDRSQVVERLQKSALGTKEEEGLSLRGTSRFGRTRTVVGASTQGDGERHTSGSAEAETEPLVAVANRPRYVPDYETPRFRLTPAHFAYVKIAEGCNHPCSFCIIPQMRGSYRSRAQSDVVHEVQRLVEEGVKEINLISQDSTYYGLDLREDRRGSIAAPGRFKEATLRLPRGATTLASLLRALESVEGDFWIRLLYTHPAHWTDELITTMAACRKVVRYADMPLQHIHDLMLERMRRETDRGYIEDLIGRIRAGIPGIALRTTFIVGFPGESAACFETLLAFVKATRFERLGVFTYSQEERTTAGRMASQVSERVKLERRDCLMAAQREVAREYASAKVGQRMRVLVEGKVAAEDLASDTVRSWEHGLIRQGGASPGGGQGRHLVARGEADAPDIDGRVYVRGRLPLGHFAWVRIVGASDYDLFAEPAD